MQPNLFDPPPVCSIITAPPITVLPATPPIPATFRLWYRRHRVYRWRVLCSGMYEACREHERLHIENDGVGDYYIGLAGVDPNVPVGRPTHRRA